MSACHYIARSAAHRKASCLQAISLLRQKKLDDTVKSLNNLLACDKALPADRAVSWDERAELQDLFSTYVSRVRPFCRVAYGLKLLCSFCPPFL